MSRTHTIALLLATAFISTLATTQAHAVQRTHVSAAIGTDTNTAANCTPVAPCRTFQAAMTVTDTNGEVVVLDSGGYGAVNITQSVSLIAPTGVYAGISVFAKASGVTIATPGINVVLRGIAINGQGGDSGIVMTAGNKLTVENCVISNLKEFGILAIGDTIVRIADTIIRDNAVAGIFLDSGPRATITRTTVSGNGDSGIIAVGGIAATLTTADIADSTVDGNAFGINAFSSNATALVKLSVRDSRVVRNVKTGIVAESKAGADVTVSASNNIVSNNNQGMVTINAGAKMWASGNTVSSNSLFGLFNNNGTAFESVGNNAVRNNGTNKSGPITVIPAE
jgi:hypothetical protein